MEKIYLLFAAAGGAIFAEMSLRSWRLLAAIIFSRRTERRPVDSTSSPAGEKESGSRIEEKGPEPEAARVGRAPVLRFLFLKTAALALPVALFLAFRAKVGKQGSFAAVLVFAGAYLVYLFIRSWRLKDSGIHTAPPP